MNMECTTFHSSNQNHEIPIFPLLLHFAFAARSLDLITVEGYFTWHGQVNPTSINALRKPSQEQHKNLMASNLQAKEDRALQLISPEIVCFDRVVTR